MPLGWVAGATALAGVAGAATSLIGAGQASDAAGQAADVQRQAANQADARYQQTRTDLSPYFQPGYNALTDAYALARQPPPAAGRDYVDLAYQNLPGQMTQAQLEQTPGYQFDLSQGQKAVQSAAAARGLGVSGASLKGAANFATGLANKTYLDQFNVAQKRFDDIAGLNTQQLAQVAQQQGILTNQFNRLNAIGTLGENAAAQTGSTGAALSNTATSALNTAGNYINQGGLASAAGTTGASNALTGSVNNYLAYQNMQNYLNPKTGGYDAVGNAYSAPNTPQAWAAQQGVY